MLLKVYSPEAQNYETLIVDIEDDGWFISHDHYRGLSNQQCAPHLAHCLHQSRIKFPPDIDDAMGALWISAQENGMTEEEVQTQLHEISIWMRSYDVENEQQALKAV